MGERFTNAQILKKIQKIRALIEDGEVGESAQAQRILDKILDKYELDETALEDRELVKIAHAWEMRHIVKHIAWSLELEVFSGGRWKDKLFIKVTPSELEIFNTIWFPIRKLYLAKKKMLNAQLQGYMSGFLDRSYSVKGTPECPKCGLELEFKKQEKRYVCSCGYTGKKLKVRMLDADSYQQGANDSGTLLEHKVQ